MIVLLAFLPLQAWVGVSTPVPQAQTSMHAVIMVADPVLADQADFAVQDTPAGPGMSADSAEPSPPSVDFAEQLLPAPMPRVAAPPVRGALPRYASITLPDPDLPRVPRPPRG